MDFRPLNTEERRQLIHALRGNAESDRAILRALNPEDVPDRGCRNTCSCDPQARTSLGRTAISLSLPRRWRSSDCAPSAALLPA